MRKKGVIEQVELRLYARLYYRTVLLLMMSVAIMLPGSFIPFAMADEITSDESAKPAAVPQEKLDALLAPIALYPDQLLTQALIASTYPLDVVAATRFVKENKELKGEALDKAVLEKDWDPSVQSLTAFPQVLEMMNDKLEWTQELGDAFLADEARVMQTVQSLRKKADEAGNLQSNEQQSVVKEDSVIIIESAKTEIVYVPTYNPSIVYGVWWAPMYPPYYWPPPPYYYPGYRPGGAFVIGFSIGWVVGVNHWGWCRPAWHRSSVNININKNNVFINNNANFKSKVKDGNWQHNPAQRKGVAYRDASTRDRFRKVDSNAVSSRRDARGFEPGRSDRPASTVGPGTRDAQRPGSGGTGSRDLQRPGAGQTKPGKPSTAGRPSTPGAGGAASGNRSSDVRPSFDANHSRTQTNSFSNRGASSRATMNRGGGGRGGRGR